MSDHAGVDGEGQGATPTGSGCRPADRDAARPAPAGFHPSREAFLQKAMRFIDCIAGDGEVEITTPQGEHLASVDLCKEFAALHGCEIWDEEYSILIGYQPDAPCDEPPSGRDRNGLGGDSPAGAVGGAEAPDQISTPMSEPAEEKIARLTRERDEADRRAGAAEREMSSLKEDARKERWWLEDAKRARGYDIGVSFDTVWAETCAKADKADQITTALAESERKRAEAESLLTLRTRQGTQAQEAWARAAEQALSGDPRALHDKFARWRDPGRLAAIVQSATPTQETSHVES